MRNRRGDSMSRPYDTKALSERFKNYQKIFYSLCFWYNSYVFIPTPSKLSDYPARVSPEFVEGLRKNRN